MNPSNTNPLATPVLTHRRFRCRHGGVGPESTWIGDSMYGFCTRANCELAKNQVPLPYVDEDQTTLTGVALLTCDGCLASGRNPNTMRSRVCATDTLACAEVSCGHPVHIALIGATPDVARWKELGERRLREARHVPAAAAAAAAVDKPRTLMERLCNDPGFCEKPVVTANVFECDHNGKGVVTKWRADTLISYCRAGLWCDACRERRALTPTPTNPNKIQAAALATCPACLDAGRSPNTVCMRTCMEDTRRCRVPRCGGQLQIRAVVALADIDGWIRAGEAWVMSAAENEAAEMEERMKALALTEADIIAECQRLDSLDDIFRLTSGASKHVAFTVASDWLARSHAFWDRRHPNAAEELATMLAQPRSLALFMERCSFCGTSCSPVALSVRFCATIRKHLLRGHTELTVACSSPSCVEQACTVCRLAPAGGTARDAAADVDAAIPSIGATKLLQECRANYGRFPAVFNVLRRDDVGIEMVRRVADEFLAKQMSDAWRAENPASGARLVEMIRPSGPPPAACSFCGVKPPAGATAAVRVCQSFGAHLARTTCKPTFCFGCCDKRACTECRAASACRVKN